MTKINEQFNIGIVAPFNLKNKDGNTIRPIKEAEGLNKFGIINIILYCLERNENIKITQKEINRSLLRFIPKIFWPKDSPFLFHLPVISKLKLESNLEILHLTNYYSILILPRKKKLKVVVDYHAWKSVVMKDLLKYLDFKNKLIYYFTLPVIKYIEKIGVKKADKIIVASENIKQCILNTYHLKKDKIIVIHNSIDVNSFTKNKYSQEFFVGVIGPFTDKINNVIPFVIELSKKMDVKIKLVGEISNHNEELLKNFSNIEILGKLKDNDYLNFLEEVGVILLPYTFYFRGGGPKNKLLEACAAGIPVISTDGGAIGFEHKEKLLTANNLKEFVESINMLKNSPDLRKKIGVELIQIIEADYNPKIESEKLLNVYKELI